MNAVNASASLGRAEAFAEQHQFLLHRAGHVDRAVTDQPLGQADRLRRQRGEPLRDLVRRIHQRRVVHHAIDEAPLVRGSRVQRFAEQQQRAGALVAEQPREQQRTCRLGHQAQTGERHHESCRTRGDDQVAMHQHGGADADRRTVHRGDQRLLHRRDRRQEARRRTSRPLLPRGLEVGDVVARGEGVAGAGQQRDAQRRIGIDLGERIGHRVIHGAGQRVLFLRPVEPDLQHAIAAGEDDVFGHRVNRRHRDADC